MSITHEVIEKLKCKFIFDENKLFDPIYSDSDCVCVYMLDLEQQKKLSFNFIFRPRDILKRFDTYFSFENKRTARYHIHNNMNGLLIYPYTNYYITASNTLSVSFFTPNENNIVIKEVDWPTAHIKLLETVL